MNKFFNFITVAVGLVAVVAIVVALNVVVEPELVVLPLPAPQMPCVHLPPSRQASNCSNPAQFPPGRTFDMHLYFLVSQNKYGDPQFGYDAVQVGVGSY